MLRRHLMGSTALLALVLPAAAHAQSTDGAVSLPPISVTTSAPGSLTVPGVEDQKKALDETVGSVGFVDSEQIQDRYAANLHDVLEDAPGVFVGTRYGQELRVSIRGSGISRAYHTRGVEILQDGIPWNLADGSGDYYQIDPLAFRAAEIYKGGNGLAMGSAMMGGAINFVSPTAYTAVAPNMVRATGGSFGTVQANGQASRIVGDGDFLANLTLTHADGYRRHELGDYGQFNGNVGYRLGADVETRFYVGVFAVDQLLPGTLTLNDALHSPRSASASALSGDQARNTRVERVANRTTFAVGGGKLDLDTWFIHKSLYHPIFQVIDQDGVTYGVAPRFTGDLMLGEHRNEVIVGGRVFAGSTAARQYVNNGGSRGAQTLNARQDAFNYEGYLENRFFLVPQLALMTGVKVLHDERDYEDRGGLPADPNAKSASRSYDGVNPKIGLLWQPKPAIQAFVDLTRSQDVPDFSDLNQTIGTTNTFVPLAAQHAWTVEAGTRGRQDRFGWDVSAYNSWVRDELLQYTVSQNVPASTFNASQTVHRGIELGAEADIVRGLAAQGDRLTLRQLWNWSDFRFIGDAQYGDNRLPGVPEHLLRTTLTYATSDGFYVAPNVEWVPEGAWVDYANTMKAPSYALLGLRTGITLENGLSLYLDARNLTDRRYVSDFGPVTDARTASTAVFYPGEGRSVYGGVRYAF